MPRLTFPIPVLSALTVLLVGCADRDTPTDPSAAPPLASAVTADAPTTPALIRELAAERGIGPLPQPEAVRPALAQLGQALFFDKILSGNRDISCATCHLPRFASGDGKSLAVGQGGTGLGPTRSHPRGAFIPRNSPPMFNLGAMRHLFWDGRVQVDEAGRILTPAGDQVTPAMSRVFEFGAVSALGLFPVTNRAEMRADAGNELAAIPDDDFTRIWSALMARLGAIPEYRALFEAAYPRTRFRDMTFAHASNAIGAFFVDRLTFTGSPWDRFLAGSDRALSPRQLEGARTFLTLKCSICHSGPTLSDEDFHNVAVAQLGPGRGDGEGGRDDFGRMNVTGSAAERYRFRSTPLRNVELTAPYGHDGAIVDLRAFVEHYSESDLKLFAYDPSQLESALRGTVLANASEILEHRDPLLEGVVLTTALVDQLMDYMSALTDPTARELTRNSARIIPARVPSGLPVDRP
jgi:cytochrome c peroxidase